MAAPLTDQAIAKIKELIISGEFTPGSKLPGSMTWPSSSASPVTRCAKRFGR